MGKKKNRFGSEASQASIGTKNGGGFSSLNMYGETSLKKGWDNGR